MVTAPTELVPLFVSVFTQREIPLHFGLYTELYTELRLELLHMMGALLSSVEVISMSQRSVYCRSQDCCCSVILVYTYTCRD